MAQQDANKKKSKSGSTNRKRKVQPHIKKNSRSNMSFARSSKTSMAPIAQSVTVGSNATKTVCVVFKRDLVGSIEGSPTFNLAPIDGALSPSNSALFSWLSGIAESFDYIEWDHVKMQFVSSSPSTSAGRVYMCADYDPSDPAPTNASQFMSQQDSISGGVWNSFELRLSQRELKRFKRYFTKRNKTDPEPADSMPGNIFVAVDGTPTGKIGDLYIEYGVKLTVPSVNSALEKDKMLIQWTNTSAGADFPDPNWGLGGSLNNPRITTKSTDQVLIPATTYSGFPGFRLTPRNVKLVLHAVTQAFRAAGGATTGFLDCFQNITNGYGTNPLPIPSTRWRGLEYILEDPDSTGALTFVESPVNKSETPVIANVNGATGLYFSNDTFMSYDHDSVLPGARAPMLRVTAKVPTLKYDQSNFGAVVAANGTNASSIQQSTTTSIIPSTLALGVKDARLFVSPIIE